MNRKFDLADLFVAISILSFVLGFVWAFTH